MGRKPKVGKKIKSPDRSIDNKPMKKKTTSLAVLVAPSLVMNLEPIKLQRSNTILMTTMSRFLATRFLPQGKCDIDCWWCRHSFDTAPIGVPIKRYDQQHIVGYTPECYETDGIFCSFPCAMAYIEEHLKLRDPLYKDSSSLLNEIYYRVYNKQEKIIAAPSWKKLKICGGDASITQFKNTFGDEMLLTSNLATQIYQIPFGHYIELK